MPFFFFLIQGLTDNLKDVYRNILLTMQYSESLNNFLNDLWPNILTLQATGHHVFYCSFQAVLTLLGSHIFISYLGRLPFWIQKKPRYV